VFGANFNTLSSYVLKKNKNKIETNGMNPLQEETEHSLMF
jgi:hypothetical protein